MSEWGTTTRLRAVATLANGDVNPGDIHLLDWVHHRAGPETPLEMLNRPESFIAMTQEDGQTLFIPKAQLAMVSCEWPPEGWPPEGLEAIPDPGRILALSVRLSSGEAFEGLVSVALPTGRARALDYLNATGPFFQLVTDGTVRLINRAHVCFVRPIE